MVMYMYVYAQWHNLRVAIGCTRNTTACSLVQLHSNYIVCTGSTNVDVYVFLLFFRCGVGLTL